MPSNGRSNVLWLLTETRSRRSPRVPVGSLCFPGAAVFLSPGTAQEDLRQLNSAPQCLLHPRTGFSSLGESHGRVCFLLWVHILIFIQVSPMWLMPSSHEDSCPRPECCMKARKLEQASPGHESSLTYLLLCLLSGRFCDFNPLLHM